MALFSSRQAYLGVDLGTSTSKIVELEERGGKIELVTYAESNAQNVLVNPAGTEQEAIEETIQVLKQMIEKSGAAAKNVVAALPGGSVFSTVLMLPNIPESEMEKAVKFAARDVVPADINEMILGWSTVGSQSHMATDRKKVEQAAAQPAETIADDSQKVPVFVTAAPKDIVNRYIAVFQRLQMTLLALEVETFPLVRSLLPVPPTSTLLVDIGAHAMTFHIIDKGIPRVSQTIDAGGHDLAGQAHEKEKIEFGILPEQNPDLRASIEASLQQQAAKATELLAAYKQKENAVIENCVLIGGGANLKGLPEYWTKAIGIQTVVGNPWGKLTLQKDIEPMLMEIGPRYGVAVGLALRGFAQQ